jgi:5-methylcytosine-specific restriction endonuclease McrA
VAKIKAPPTKDAFAKNELRKAFKRWIPKNKCKILARIERGKYQCAHCKELFKENETEVDHKNPVVPLDIAGKDQPMQDYVDRLFVEVEDLACLCKTCHKAKSATEMGLRKINRAKRKENEEK